MKTEERLGRRVLVSTASQLAAKALHLLLNVISTLAIVHFLAPGAYGSYVLVATVIGLFGLVADFGLGQLAVREIAAATHSERDVIGTIIVLRLGLSAAAMVGTQLVLVAMGQPEQIRVAAAVASLLFVTNAVLTAIVVSFQVRVLQQYDAFIQIGMACLETGFILALVASHASLPMLFLPPVVGTAVGTVAAYALARRQFGLRPCFNRRIVGQLLIQAIPIGPALLIGVVYLKLDSLTLAVMRPKRELGLYGSAYQPIEYLFLGTAIVINVVFPLLSGAFGAKDHARFLALYQRGTEAVVVLTLIVPVTLWFVAQPMVTTVFGSDYARAAAPLRLLGIALVLMAVNGWQSFVLLAGGLQAVTLKYNMIALLLAVVLCVAAVAAFGLVGAACAALGTAVYVLYASTSAARRHLQVRLDPARLARVASAGAITVPILAALRLGGTPWPLLCLASVVAYFGTLALLGVHRSFTSVLA